MYVMLTWVMGGIGIIMSFQQKSCNNICIALYAIFMLFAIAIPLMSEGTALMDFDRIDYKAFDSMCKKPIEVVRQE